MAMGITTVGMAHVSIMSTGVTTSITVNTTVTKSTTVTNAATDTTGTAKEGACW